MYHIHVYPIRLFFMKPHVKIRSLHSICWAQKDQNYVRGVVNILALPRFQSLDPGENENSKLQVKKCSGKNDASRVKQVCQSQEICLSWIRI